ncbi:hypothetical protein ABWE90_01360 [Pasteurella multocida]|uniref:hypothetical protein n=1 Tax=Pasteurella multocida TaxID=747 RepID=UPI0002839182|nr:hypothetical protein [Pasteurella multocida]ARB76462.1 hypothetical protein A6J57_09590 [Pasteurella multocida]EJZ80307.1 hypothetical protein P1059_00745 [Pasteurella multocida subsp. gallicida P1059]NMR51796.1 hypothetical protein [Pasteurella multocida]NMR61736.1 hypothetical protein [Pasteurella multocida]OBP30577.1 hypothetical protein A0R67_04115 [Pasteurella multocida subsp. multocida]
MKHINIWNMTAAFIIALVLGISCNPVHANELQKDSDYYNHYLSEQISKEQLAEMEREASEEWKKEHGDIPPNLASEQLIYMRVYAMEQQELLNGTR